jgi:hypothetical protein
MLKTLEKIARKSIFVRAYLDGGGLTFFGGDLLVRYRYGTGLADPVEVNIGKYAAAMDFVGGVVAHSTAGLENAIRLTGEYRAIDCPAESIMPIDIPENVGLPIVGQTSLLQLVEAFKATEYALSTGSARPQLNNFHLNPRGWVETTDGYRGCWQEITPGLPDMMFPPAVAKILAACKDAPIVSLHRGGEKYGISTPDLVVEWSAPGSFPGGAMGVRSFVPPANTAMSIPVDGLAFVAALKELAKFQTNGTVTLETGYISQGLARIPAPWLIFPEKFSVKFQLKYLRNAVTKQTKKVTFDSQKVLNAWIFGESSLLMPVRP